MSVRRFMGRNSLEKELRLPCIRNHIKLAIPTNEPLGMVFLHLALYAAVKEPDVAVDWAARHNSGRFFGVGRIRGKVFIGAVGGRVSRPIRCRGAGGVGR